MFVEHTLLLRSMIGMVRYYTVLRVLYNGIRSRACCQFWISYRKRRYDKRKKERKKERERNKTSRFNLPYHDTTSILE